MFVQLFLKNVYGARIKWICVHGTGNASLSVFNSTPYCNTRRRKYVFVFYAAVLLAVITHWCFEADNRRAAAGRPLLTGSIFSVVGVCLFSDYHLEE
mmetsp:Transcript_28485/g.42253  ORF Transcript_28485/g.42253 Transcript_28485/m.42253 type:complete len:97 (+) Transcript_28485:49-339(+)